MPDEPIEIEFVNTLPDHLAACREYERTTLGRKLDRVVAVLLATFGVVLVAISGPEWWALIWFPLAACEWLGLLSLDGLRTRLAFRSDPRFREPYRLSFSDRGIHFRTETIDAHVDWKLYRRTIIGERVILLVHGRRQYTVVPKSAFRDPADLDQFLALIGRAIRP